MKEYYEVDDLGNRIEVHVFGEEDIIPPNHFPSWGNRVFHNPKWDFNLNDWVEGKDTIEIISEAKVRKFNELSNKCEKEILGYFEATVNSVPFSFSFDREAQGNFTGTLALFTEGLITEQEWTVWKDGVAERIILDKSSFLLVIQQAFMHKNKKIARLRNELQPPLDSATTIDEINLIVW